jgi:hypothetical protein
VLVKKERTDYSLGLGLWVLGKVGREGYEIFCLEYNRHIKSISLCGHGFVLFISRAAFPDDSARVDDA